MKILCYKKYFKAVNIEDKNLFFEFLKETSELSEKENYFFKLINGIVEIHGFMNINSVLKI